MARYAFCLLIVFFLHGTVQSFSITMWCPDILSVYVDGVQQEFTGLEFVSRGVPERSRLVAVLCQRPQGDSAGGRFIASTPNGLVSSEDWKCQEQESSDRSREWAEVDFDDSDWQQAVVRERNDGTGWIDETFPRSANYIWATPASAEIVVFRAKIGPVAVILDCNGEGTYYIDGVESSFKSYSWGDSLQLAQDNLPILLAVKCSNAERPPAIIGAAYDGDDVIAQTGDRWKCSPEVATDWYSMGFDDSSWEDASIYLQNSGPWLNERFPNTANYINHAGDVPGDAVCRFTLDYVPNCDPDEAYEYFRHPTDCSRYTLCKGGVPEAHQCTGTDVFNPLRNLCDFPDNVDCTVTTTTAVTTVTTSTPTTTSTTTAEITESPCASGYELSDDLICVDFNECEQKSTNQCSHVCENTPGSYQCECPEGYELDSDGITCNDVDECLQGDQGCVFKCVNTPGSFVCSCPSDEPKCNDSDGDDSNSNLPLIVGAVAGVVVFALILLAVVMVCRSRSRRMQPADEESKAKHSFDNHDFKGDLENGHADPDDPYDVIDDENMRNTRKDVTTFQRSNGDNPYAGNGQSLPAAQDVANGDNGNQTQSDDPQYQHLRSGSRRDEPQYMGLLDEPQYLGLL